MLIGSCAAIAIIALATHAPSTPHAIGAHEARDALLAEPAPFPGQHTVTHRAYPPRRSFTSVTHANVFNPASAQLYSPTAPYGAHPAHANEVALARINHQSLAIDPWTPIQGRGSLARLENARNQWLREQGFVEHVRTHTNALPPDNVPHEAATTLPTPRGILELSPAKPRLLRVDASPR